MDPNILSFLASSCPKGTEGRRRPTWQPELDGSGRGSPPHPWESRAPLRGETPGLGCSGCSFPLALSHHAVLSGCKTFHLLCYHLPPMPSYPAMSQAHLSTNVCCGCAQSPVMPDSLRPHGLQCSPLSSFVHGILQAAILEWVAIFSSRGSS